MRQETELEKWRCREWKRKEPETIAWIDSFEKGDTFLDIGANIGIYSLYAASRGVRVVAVEPHPGNFQALATNQRFLNRHLSIRPVLGGVGKMNRCMDFFFNTIEAGSTGGKHGTNGKSRQYVRVYTVDYLIRWYGPFAHIKIDVDGEERGIVQGMKTGLRARAFKSCLIEADPKTKAFILARFEENGYTTASPLNTMTPHSRERRKKEGIDVENIIFSRI